MSLSPRLLGALAAVLVTGVTSGAVLGRVPAMQQRGFDEWLPQAASTQVAYDLEHAPQDQYAIETPEGRFEIAQLSDRGLNRNARYNPAFAYGAYDAYLAAEPAAYAEPSPASGVIEVSAEAPPVDAEPLAGTQVAEVTPRIIDVTAELAARAR